MGGGAEGARSESPYVVSYKVKLEGRGAEKSMDRMDLMDGGG